MTKDGKVAVITGAASGLGLALTKRCLERNISVVMADNDVEALSKQVHLCNNQSEAHVLGVLCDVSQPESIRQMAEQTQDHFGRIDLLINNAGISGPVVPYWELTSEALEAVMKVNLFGVLHCTQSFLPLMFSQSWRSRVINIASIYSVCTSSCMAAYSMTKHALLAFSESLYFDLQRLNKPVDVSIVCPSFMNTNLLSNALTQDRNTLHGLLEDLMKNTRDVDDVAACILREIEHNMFYILPDQEIKHYGEQRLQGLIDQKMPCKNSLEKLINGLGKRLLGAPV